jgi:hypothetical protein
MVRGLHMYEHRFLFEAIQCARARRHDSKSSPTVRASARRIMTQQFGDAIVTVECSECGARMKRTVANLRSDARLQCSDCWSAISVDGEQLQDALQRFAIAYHSAWMNRSTGRVPGLNHSLHDDASASDNYGEVRVIDSRCKAKDVKSRRIRRRTTLFHRRGCTPTPGRLPGERMRLLSLARSRSRH